MTASARAPHDEWFSRAAAVLLVLLCAAAAVPWYRHHHRHALAQVSAAELQDAAPLPRTNHHRRLEPAGNTVLHGAGQTNLESFLEYKAVVAPARPTVFMTYVDLRDDLPGFFQKLAKDLDTADALPQIGLSLNRGNASQHYEGETAQGNDDAALDHLCTGLNALHRPVFLRPGYEFNGRWNGYLPTGYIAALRRIATRVHTCAPNTAIVWDWSADAELDAEAGGNTAPAASRWQPFYPGDDVVDWWALNLFTSASIRSAATEEFLQAAARSQHPVMIAESTPKGYQIASSRLVWQDWFAPYFTLVHRHPGIRAFCYINWNWSGYPQWADWGDGRVQTAPPALQQQLRSELTRPLYTADRTAPSAPASRPRRRTK